MAERVLEINVAYAQGLKDVNLFTKMDVYVTVSIVGGNNKYSSIKQKTNVDRDSGTHPTWNFPMRFTVDDLPALQGRSSIVFKLKCEGSLADTNIGEVCVPIKDLLLDSSSVSCESSKLSKFVHYQVTTPSGKGKGTLTFSYKFLEKVFGADQTVEPVERAVEATTLQPTTYPTPDQQPMEPILSHCGFSCQDTYRPNTYPQTPPPVPYAYPALPEQVLGSGYVVYPPAPNSYPPPPDPKTGFIYIYPPPQSAGPNYAYVPYQQPLQQLVCPPPSSAGQYVYPYPPQADGCPPQAYPGYW